MLEALHKAGHKYLKLLFVLALAGSSTLFFIGTAIPKPPGLVIIVVGGVLGVAIEWSYFVVSCDLTESITRGHKGGVALNLLYTIAGGVASWFLFTNAALHVGWAPTDDLIGLSRVHWAMILAGLIVVVVFVLSARRKPVQNEMDMSAIARSIEIHMPNAPQAVRMRMLKAMLDEAEQAAIQQALPPGRTIEADPASRPAKPGLLKRGWQVLWSGSNVEQEAPPEEEEDETAEETEEQDINTQSSTFDPAVPPPAPSTVESADYLPRTIEALTATPNITDEALAEVLGLKRPASARFWRLRAHEVLNGHRLIPTPARLNDEQRPRSRQETLDDLRGFAQALKADTGFDLEALIQRALGRSSGTTASEAEPQTNLPFPAVHTGQPVVNHANHGVTQGVYERWGGEGEGRDDNISFREPSN